MELLSQYNSSQEPCQPLETYWERKWALSPSVSASEPSISLQAPHAITNLISTSYTMPYHSLSLQLQINHVLGPLHQLFILTKVFFLQVSPWFPLLSFKSGYLPTIKGPAMNTLLWLVPSPLGCCFPTASCLLAVMVAIDSPISLPMRQDPVFTHWCNGEIPTVTIWRDR